MCVVRGEDLRGLRKLIVFLSILLVQIQTVAKALCPKDIERLSQVYRQHAHIFLNLEEH